MCEPSNASGLQIAFFHDDERQVVEAEFALGPAFSGPPRAVHGGVVLAVLDEAMAWAAIALAGCFAVTRTTQARFHRPVALAAAHTVEARLVARRPDGDLDLAAAVRDGAGRCCAQADGRFAPLSARRAAGAVGPVAGADARYVRP